MNLLENELVKKYFGSGECQEGMVACTMVPRCMSYRILKAMHEPIRKGLLVLESDWNQDHQEWKEKEVGDEIRFYANATQEYHPGSLVLPDEFQKKQCTSGYHENGKIGSCIVNCECDCHGKKDEVEEKIKEICNKHYTQYLNPDLRELVELVRNNK